MDVASCLFFHLGNHFDGPLENIIIRSTSKSNTGTNKFLVEKTIYINTKFKFPSHKV